MTTQPIRITHIITALPRGGAQTVLQQLLRRGDPRRVQMDVVSLADIGAVGERLIADGFRVRALGMRRGSPNPMALWRLAGWLRQGRPDLVQTWLYHGDLVGGLAARLAGIPVLWNLRQTDLDPAHTGAGTLWTMRACARLSHRIPRRIVSCSEATARIHVALGYDRDRLLVIPNGVDLERFHPAAEARQEVRAALGLDANVPLVGLFARFHPQKDHASFLAAIRTVANACPEAHYLLCGEGIDGGNAVLGEWVRASGVPGRIHLLGIRDDVPHLAAALDLAVSSSSFGEGFSNVLVEAMACGTACVTTDVGDSGRIVGKTGWVVPARQPAALGQAIVDALADRPGLAARGREARARVEAEYSISAMVERYQNLYEGVARGAQT